MNASRHHLAEVIGKRSLRVRDSHKLAQEIAAYLLETNQTASLESLLRDVMVYRAEHGIIEATAVSAHELNSEVRKEIKGLIKSEYPKVTSTLLQEKIDPAVIGGVRIEMPGEQLDATVDAKVNLFKRLTAQERD